jgi:hypothetical protein
MESKLSKQQSYVSARKRVEKMGKFYKHLAVYLIVNTFLSVIFIVADINDGATFTEAFWNYGNYKVWLFWGIGILFQAINVFGLNYIFNKEWEENKIREYMRDQKQRK